MDIAVIGGGASGLAAALAARESLDNHVTVFERQNRVGRKLLATGNGRCNLTNLGASLCAYHGHDLAFISPTLGRFGPEETLRWFEGMGVITTAEVSGRVYPISDTASSVVDVIRLALESRGGVTLCGQEIARAKKAGERFLLTSAQGEKFTCDKLIIACGGAAGARLGGVRSGYELLASFGHRLTELRPSLVQLKTENTWTRPLKGVRTQVDITIEQGNEVLASAHGELQFTDYGVTGPAVYDVSRAATFAGQGCTVALRLLPEIKKIDIINYLISKRNDFPDLRAENILTGALHNSIGRAVLRRAGIPLDARLWALTDGDLKSITERLCRYELPLLGTLGFDEAQVTAGGIETADFDPESMESRLVPGLYACGEVLDVDGDCGGYNLQWAWSSGRLAGSAAGGILT